ncbi:MAG: hypothetical protein NTY08_00260 [Proteobacteria bacterium]|nr:hypothetical protein [Pseudomonadota bacterium]
MTMWSRLKTLVSAVFIGLALSQAAFAVDFSAADSLFSQRENNRANISQARALYVQILNQATTVNDKIRAAEQLGRLALYEGEMLLAKSDSSSRKTVFGDCWCRSTSLFSRSCNEPGWVEKISPSAIGQRVPAYYYYRGMCIGYWGEASNVIEQAAFSGALREAVNGGLDLASSNSSSSYYEGGAVHRVAANVWSNPLARAVGLYDAKQALAQIETALAAPASGGQDPGALYFDNHRSKIIVLKQLNSDDPSGGWKQKAIDFANETLLDMADRLEQDQLPAARVAEFNVIFAQLKIDYRGLTGRDWQP